MNTIIEGSLNLLGKNKLSRLLTFSMMIIVAIVASITLILSELKKQDISKSQLEIEKNRVVQIDKKLSLLYEEAYTPLYETTNNESEQNLLLKQIDFLKKQRIEAVKSIDDINRNPDTEVLIFTLFASILTIFVLFFFSNSFKTSIYTSKTTINETINKLSQNQREKLFQKNRDFLNWATTNELANNNISHIAIQRAKLLKDLYDKSENLGEEQKGLLNTVIDYTNLKREEEDVKNDKFAAIILVFNDIQERVKEECNRLNKQALINLLLCFFIAFILMTIITYTSVFSTDISAVSMEIVLSKFLPRIIAVAGLLTMFLYFIKLYKTNIMDVKYYQNELTNISVMQVAWQTTIISGDTDLLKDLIKEISNVDRNKVISKDETSLEIERIKLENEINKDYLGKVFDLLSINKKE